MKELPIDQEEGHNSHLRVLVPGAGLGRLAVEIAAKGYRYVEWHRFYCIIYTQSTHMYRDHIVDLHMYILLEWKLTRSPR